MHTTICRFGSLVWLGMAASAHAQGRAIDIKAPDGIVLKASYYAANKPGPGILLFHQCNMDRRAWDPLARDLAAAGIHVLTYDQRGFGETGGTMPVPPLPKMPPSGDPREPVGMAIFPPGDADAALAVLLAQTGVDATRLAVGGASCGVAEAGELARRRTQIAAVVLLSGMVATEAAAYLAATPSVSVFGAVAADDGAFYMQRDLRVSRPGSVFTTYPGNTHGVALFDSHPELGPSIVSWLAARLAGRER